MEQRRTRRFNLQLPLSITRSGAERVMFSGYTQNISSSGVLFTSESETGLGGPIEYVIRLNEDAPQTVHIRCVGKVVRTAPIGAEPAPAFQIAATLERYEFVRTHAGPALASSR